MNVENPEIKCPKCGAQHFFWRGVETPDSRDLAPADAENRDAILHKWQCVDCGEDFKQAIESPPHY